MSLENLKIINFQNKGDERGRLTIIEGNNDIPFDIKRIFYMKDTDINAIRGKHANRNSNFVLVALSGSIKVKVIDEKNNEKTFTLDNSSYGLYVPKMIWKEMFDFSKDSILMVLSDLYYDEKEYIRNFEEYKKEMNND